MPATTKPLTLVPLQRDVAESAARSDDELMLLARGGKAAAFDLLVQRHQARVLRLAARYLGNASLAPDVAQRAFVELYRARDRYQANAKFWPYLACITLNHCRMTARSEKRHQGVELANADLAGQDDVAQLACVHRRDLELAMSKLSARLREVVVLRYVAALSLEEIGEILKIPLGTVKSRLFAGLKKLRVAMGGKR